MWKCAIKYCNYEVCDNSQVRDTILGNLVTPRKNRAGYLSVYLPYAAPNYFKRNGEASYTHSLHVVVADVHLPPPKYGQTIVDHINGDRTYCSVTNLRWLSPSANNYNRKGTRGYSGTKFEKGEMIKAPDGHVFPVVWVRNADGKRERRYSRPVKREHALEVAKTIRENLIALMCANPFMSSGVFQTRMYPRRPAPSAIP